MENYVKEILFGYPLLRTVGKDYEIHIRNKAILSHGGNALRLAEYLAAEILEMRRLEELQSIVKDILGTLREEERALLEIRYFGKRNRMRGFLKKRIERGEKPWSTGTYFRRQRAVGNKVGEMLRLRGITQEKFEREFASVDIFRKIRALLEAGAERKLAAQERVLKEGVPQAE